MYNLVHGSKVPAYAVLRERSLSFLEIINRPDFNIDSFFEADGRRFGDGLMDIREIAIDDSAIILEWHEDSTYAEVTIHPNGGKMDRSSAYLLRKSVHVGK